MSQPCDICGAESVKTKPSSSVTRPMKNTSGDLVHAKFYIALEGAKKHYDRFPELCEECFLDILDETEGKCLKREGI